MECNPLLSGPPRGFPRPPHTQGIRVRVHLLSPPHSAGTLEKCLLPFDAVPRFAACGASVFRSQDVQVGLSGCQRRAGLSLHPEQPLDPATGRPGFEWVCLVNNSSVLNY